MSNATITKASVKRDAVATSAASDAARHASATRALETLTNTLAQSAAAGLSVVVKRYGNATDSEDAQKATLTSVKLAKRVAAVLAGGAKPRGGAGQDINHVLASLDGIDTLTDVVLVAASRNRLDAESARKRARIETKKALADKHNDSSAPVAARVAALETLAGMEAEDAKAKSQTIVKRLNDALMAARVDGLAESDALALVAAAYAVAI